jgi:signal transduction histidine kinase
MMDTQIPPREVPRVLVVDDTPANLQLLVGMLKERGYKALVAPSGKMALQAAQNDPPDLILLDINMPEMNGYEVCERLKADEKLKEIPVIFVSALNETMDKVKAFGAGGVDYVTKPFQFEEVDARVRAHLELRRQKRELKDSYERLKELERLRDNLTNMIVHDLRSPLTGVHGTLQILEKDAQLAQNPKLGFLVQLARRETNALIEMVTQLLDISRLEAGQMPVKKASGDLVESARAAVGGMASLAEGRRLAVSAEGRVPAVYDFDIVRRVITNLLANAVKFTRKDGRITVAVSRTDAGVRVAVTDDGDGIPPEYHQKIFDKFGQVNGNKARFGTGLGLTFCKLAVESHGGRIGVESEPGKGSTFWFTLPAPQPSFSPLPLSGPIT